MRTRSWRRWGGPAAWALALVVGGPTLAEAQVSALFPLRPIRRERVPCPMEDPVYRLYRHQYFGYHPTCWRRFPAGWGCPSPEAPNAAAEFQKLPRDQPPTDTGDAAGPETAPGPDDAAMPGGRSRPESNGLPPLPSGDRSPFELDRPGSPAPAEPRGAGATGRDNRAPADTPAPPVDAPAPDPAAPGLPPAAEARPPAASPSLAASPAPDASAPAANAPNARPEEPLLALPDPTIAPVAPNLIPPPGGSNEFGTATAAPAQAPRRTSLIGNFFNSLRRR